MDLGGIGFQTFPAQSHNWADGMSLNLLKMSVLMKAAVESCTAALPGSAAAGVTYVDPADNLIKVAYAGEWNSITPSDAFYVFAKDTNSFWQFRTATGWAEVPGAQTAAIPRTLAFYAPGPLRANSNIFKYISGQEFTLPANALGSVARLEVAPTANVVLSISGVGTISFLAGQTAGVFSVAADAVFQPTLVESQYSTAGVLNITSPADIAGAEGLSITLRGQVRDLTAG